MEKIGIITYHSAYNFGSVLQAMATEYIVRNLGFDAYIINYRMKSQRDFYSLCRRKYGIKIFIRDLLLLPYRKERIKRSRKFEEFIKTLNLTDEIKTPKEISKIENRFDCYISGSDQIWNKNSCELSHVGWGYMDPYLLKFTNKKRISYASSIASMNDDELQIILPYINQFEFLSFREKVSANKVSKLLNRNIDTVLDPTLLLSFKEWGELFDLHTNTMKERYILFYSLSGYRGAVKYIINLKKKAIKENLKLYVITPFLAFRYDKYTKYIYDAGPVDFLRYFYNAELIVTDSYHGTLFSINFEKQFYSITDGTGSHMRKNQILEMLGLNDRIIINENQPINIKPIDYNKVQKKICDLRNESIDYLKNALKHDELLVQ